MVMEDYVSFETAKLLKEKGFDESVSMVYMPYGDLCKLHRYDSIRNSNYNDITKNYFEYTAPTLQMAMKWLREEHQIGIFPRQYHIYKDNAVSDEFGYGVEIIKLGTDIPLNPNGEKISDKDRYFISTSYEQACEAAIVYCLKNLI